MFSRKGRSDGQMGCSARACAETLARRWRVVAMCAVVGSAGSVGMLSGGCASDQGDEDKAPVTLSTSEFIGAPTVAPAASGPKVAGAVDEEDEEAELGAAARAKTEGGVLDLGTAVAIKSAPVAPTLPPSRASSRPVILESKVGQINGRPVLASEILEPLDGRLRALTLQQTNPTAWRDAATRLIVGQLLSRVRDELVLAEAQASLTTEQRQGLFIFLRKLQEGIVSAQGGSAVQADEASLSSTGRTLQQEAQDKLDRQLIEFELRNKVGPRVIVPWRQVRNEYDKQFVKFNPAPIAKLNMVWVKSSDAEAIARMEEAIRTSGFETAAKSKDNQYLPDKAGAVEVPIKTTFAETQFFADPVLNTAARALSVGGTTERLEIRNNIAWIHYRTLDTPPRVSLYDAQLELDNQLRDKRMSVETERYFSRLFERGSFSDIDNMAKLLLEIARQRYQPQVANK